MEELVRKLSGEAHPSIDSKDSKSRESWRKDLNVLVQDIKSWLTAGVNAGVFFVTDLEIELDEDDYDRYQVPGLEIRLLTRDSRKIQVLPRGLAVVGIAVFGGAQRITGSQGRVDLVCGPARAILLRMRDDASTTRWTLVRSVGEPRDLTSDTFAEVLNELIG